MLDAYPPKPSHREARALRRALLDLLSELVILVHRRPDGRGRQDVERLRERFFASPPEGRALATLLRDALRLHDELQG